MARNSQTLAAVHTTGEEVKQFPIEIGPRFLELFSENLYTSPNKTFEELVANSWDANATAVYISIPDDLKSDSASIWVLDNGTSMDVAGLETLWTITSDHKRRAENPKRPQIGKFGIGKLATYILASEITFICKAADGKIRTVAVNYRDIEELQGVWRPDQVPLAVREISECELPKILSTIQENKEILDLISQGIPFRESGHSVAEFHHPEPAPVQTSGTWTLVLLTSLRGTGRAIQRGRIRRMLRSALPLTSDISIILNNEVLEPTKVEIEPCETWVLGRSLPIDEVGLEDVDSSPEQENVKIKRFDDSSYPYITIEGIEGKISGQVTLYRSRITGGKSADMGPSNGFFVNILGRVINLEQADFGLENLSHGPWAQFRTTLRADGLDCDLGVERNGLRDSRQVRIFKRFMMSIFNRARIALKESTMADWPKAGDILDGSWKTIPMKPLAEVVAERLATNKGLPSSISRGDIDNVDEFRELWNEAVEDNPGNLISSVKTEGFGDQLPLSHYELQTREVVVNENHPYVVERSGTIEERKLIQEFVLADFLTELYLIGHEVDSVVLDEGRAFRDEFLRLLAQLNRRTGGQIAQMLHESTDNERALEEIVGDALDYMGFNVTPMGGKGQPDGVGQAPLSPNTDSSMGPYTLTYDAKSTSKANGRVSSKDVGPGRLARHRREHDADYTLVVAPDFESGALQKECKQSQVTPMRAKDLASLLIISAKAGTFDFIEFQKIFELYDPEEVHQWVEKFISVVESQPRIRIGDLLWAFDEIGIDGPDEIETTVIADRLRSKFDNKSFPTERHVRDSITGLSVFLPAIVRNSNKQVYLSAGPKDIRNALVEQLQLLPDSIKMSIDQELLSSNPPK